MVIRAPDAAALGETITTMKVRPSAKKMCEKASHHPSPRRVWVICS